MRLRSVFLVVALCLTALVMPSVSSAQGGYAKLLALKNEGKFRAYYILSPPRTNSTAFQLALAQAPEIQGQLNEPLFLPDVIPMPIGEGRGDFDSRCDVIVAKLDKIASGQHSLPIDLVINDMTGHIMRDEMHRLIDLTDKWVVTIRHPQIQALSFLTRIIDSRLALSPSESNPGLRRLSAKDVVNLATKDTFSPELRDRLDRAKVRHWARVQQSNEALNDAEIAAAVRTVSAIAAQQFRIDWSNLRVQVGILEQRLGNQFMIVDGSDLLRNPYVIMEAVSRRMGLTYEQNMVDHWTKFLGRDFDSPVTNGNPNNGWNTPAANSTKLEYKPDSIDQIPSLASFPAVLRAEIEAALPTYAIIMGQRQVVR